MGSIPLPELSVQQPQNPLDQYSKIVGLKNLMQQSQYLPQQEAAQLAQSQATLGETQARTVGQQTENQKSALDLQIAQATMRAWSDPDLVKEATGSGSSTTAKQPDSDNIQTPYAPGQQPNFQSTSRLTGQSYPITASSGVGIDPDALLKGLAKRGVPLNVAVGQVAPFVEYAQKQLAKTTDEQALHSKALTAVADQLEPIVDETDPTKQQALVSALEDHINSSPQSYAGLDPDEMNTLRKLPTMDPRTYPAVVQHLGVAQNIVDSQKKQSDAIVSRIAAARDTLGVKAAEDMTPNKIQDFVSNQINPGGKDKDPIFNQLSSQAATLYNQTLASTGDLKEADKAIAPQVAEANRIRALPVDARAQMAARMQEGMALAAPIAQNYTETATIGGVPYTFADQGNLAKAPNAQYVGATLAQRKIPTIPEKTAASIRGLQADEQNLDQVESILSGKQPTGAGSRILVGPANAAKRILQIDPQLAALPVFQTAGLKTVRDVISSGGEGGMRGVSPEVIKLGEKIYPQPSDTAATALQKVQNLKSVINNIVQSTLPNVNPAPTRKPIDQLLSGGTPAAKPKANRRPLSEFIQ